MSENTQIAYLILGGDKNEYRRNIYKSIFTKISEIKKARPNIVNLENPAISILSSKTGLALPESEILPIKLIMDDNTKRKLIKSIADKYSKTSSLNLSKIALNKFRTIEINSLSAMVNYLRLEMLHQIAPVFSAKIELTKALSVPGLFGITNVLTPTEITLAKEYLQYVFVVKVKDFYVNDPAYNNIKKTIEDYKVDYTLEADKKGEISSVQIEKMCSALECDYENKWIDGAIKPMKQKTEMSQQVTPENYKAPSGSFQSGKVVFGKDNWVWSKDEIIY